MYSIPTTPKTKAQEAPEHQSPENDNQSNWTTTTHQATQHQQKSQNPSQNHQNRKPTINHNQNTQAKPETYTPNPRKSSNYRQPKHQIHKHPPQNTKSKPPKTRTGNHQATQRNLELANSKFTDPNKQPCVNTTNRNRSCNNTAHNEHNHPANQPE